jgi:hypothetical protein
MALKQSKRTSGMKTHSIKFTVGQENGLNDLAKYELKRTGYEPSIGTLVRESIDERLMRFAMESKVD